MVTRIAGIAVPPTCPFTNQANYADQGNPSVSYTLYCNADNSGNGIYVVYNVATYDACAQACDAYGGCGAWTLSGGSCYLKNAGGSPVYYDSGTHAPEWGIYSGVNAAGTESSPSQAQCPPGPVADTSANGGVGYTIYCAYDATGGQNIGGVNFYPPIHKGTQAVKLCATSPITQVLHVRASLTSMRKVVAATANVTCTVELCQQRLHLTRIMWLVSSSNHGRVIVR